MPRFQLIGLTPPGFIDPSIAIAADRAGGLGVLNLEFCRDEQAALKGFAKIDRYVKKRCGIKLDVGFEKFFDNLLSKLPKKVEMVILTAIDPDSLHKKVLALHNRRLRVFLETTCLEHALLGVKAGVNGIIAKGNEAGGWVGEETTFILLQRLLNHVSLPIWAHGGIGLHTAAACYAAGAAGVVLDAQLLLTRESNLPEQAKASISRMDGSETICLGERLGMPFRVYAKPGLIAIEAVRELENTLIEDSRSRPEIQGIWYKELKKRVGWDDPEKNLWPLGQDAAFAVPMAERFRTVGGVLEGMRQAIDAAIRSAKILKPLNEQSPLARSHGTKYPIVQGPMTRVSDRASFAAKVVEGGALPFLALGLLRAEEIIPILEETHEMLGDRPWGVGTLGFIPLDLRQEQFRAIQNYRPSFALIAGGRPDQARIFEADGISTYLHVPSPGLLKMFIENGVRRFIFEGRECGGHVGPRSSFVLWDAMTDVLLKSLTQNEMSDCHVLYAGGIHDALSSSMVATISTQLAERGVRVGVLLGTSYLFTEEAVATGAILKGFQEEAIGCNQTVLLESSPGHAVRCANTPYGEEFVVKKRRMSTEGKSSEEIRDALETLNIGRLRIAAKGINRHPEYGKNPKGPKYVKINTKEQRNLGIYMIGQVAAIRDRTCTIQDLHYEVSVKGSERLSELDEPSLSCDFIRRREESPCDVAIIGMACIMPKAPNLETYWENILNKIDAISEIPDNRWDWRLYFDSDRKARDKIYSRWGGFIDPVPFDTMRYGMPPNSLSSIEPLQLLTLETVRSALEDAGYADRDFPRERTSVIIGAGGGIGDLLQQYALRTNLPKFFKDVPEDILSQLPEWTEDSFPGILLNVTAGRVANRFDLGGANYTVDAACASSLAAVYSAVRELENKTSDMVIVGGADTFQNPFSYLCFSKTHAFSPGGRCRVFDQSADGTSISEGTAVLILKRLADAERDGDRIYAVVKGVGASSDGRDKGLTAPRPEGQARALERAYNKAGVPPDTVALIEAHGTGTVAGDRAEIETLKRVFEAAGASQQSCALGSVKSMIGHTKCAAGVAGLIKVAMALYHKVLPPTIGVEKPNSALAESPFYVNTETRPWVVGGTDQRRRAGVSAFGFGGTNFHTVVEEYADNFLDTTPESLSHHWSSELLIWSGNSRDELLAGIESLEQKMLQGAEPYLCDLAYTLWERAKNHPALKLAVVTHSMDDLRQKLKWAKKSLRESESLHDPRGIYFTEKQEFAKGKIAFLFPGQGSQYPDMLRDLAIQFPEVRKQFELADRVLRDQLPDLLSTHIFPPPRFSEKERQKTRKALTRTFIAQPALGAAGMACFDLLQAFEVEPQMVAGHSYGEYVALCAAGVLRDDILYSLSEARGRYIMEAADGKELGTMVAVKAEQEKIAEILQSNKDVWIANINAPRQTIISGTLSGVEKAVESLKDQGIKTRYLEVSCAFHSPLVAPAKDRLDDFISMIDLSPPRLKVFSNSSGEPYPQTPKEIATLLKEHMIHPVQFAQEIQAMYRSGARIFVEVGPRNVLTNLTQEILGEKPHLTVVLDSPGRPGLFQLQHALGQLLVNGIKINLDRFFQGRKVHELKLSSLVEEGKKHRTLSPTTWLVDGGSARPHREFFKKKASMVTPLREMELHGDKVQGGVASNPFSTSDVSKPSLVSGYISSGDEADRLMHRFQGLMQKFLETQKQVMLAYLSGSSDEETLSSELKHHISMLSSEASESKSSKASAEPTITPESVSPTKPFTLHEASHGVDKNDLTKQLLQIVSERTGYPPDMLDLDLDLEADLGIDSIKRVEILANLQQTSPSHDQRQAETAMEELTKLKTLQEIIDWIDSTFRFEPEEQTETTFMEQSQAGERQPSVDNVENRDVHVPRFLLTAVESPLTDRQPRIPSGAVFIITDDGQGIAQVTADELRKLGVRAARIKEGDKVEKTGQDLYQTDLKDPDAVVKLTELIKQELGPISGILHLLPLKDVPSFEAMSLDDWKSRVRLEVKSLFYLVKALSKDLKKAAESGTGWLIAATAMGGTFASDMEHKMDFFPVHGGISGTVKTLAEEIPNLHCKVVDFNLKEQGKTLAGFLLRELADGDEAVEVGYKDSCRFVLRLHQAPLNQKIRPVSLKIGSSWVILITGGARGIMAEVALELANRYQPNILIVGRSSVPKGEEHPETVEIFSHKDLKRVLIDRMRKEGYDVGPPEVETAFKQLCRDREMRSNLKAMQEAGAKVRYYQADVRDEQAFGALLEEIYQTYGRLDGVIHGAGVIKDKLFEEKSQESFDHVFDTKVDSAFILSRKLRSESLKFLVFFSSVAGRFGNRGQIDYTAANEVLNKMAIYLDQHWPGRIVAINWGPWSKTGMVSEEVQRQFAERGMQIIPPELGRKLLDEELKYGCKGEVEVVIGEGPWEIVEAVRPSSIVYSLPLLEGISMKSTKSGVVEIIRILDPSCDLYLQDHQIDGKPVYPMAMAMELMAQVVKQGWPDREVVGIRSIKLLKGIVLNDGPKKIRIAATAKTILEDNLMEVDVEIVELDRTERPSYCATVQLEKTFPIPEPYDPGVLSKLPPFSMTVEEVYQRWLFHGNCFQGISKIEGMNEKGICALLFPSSPGDCLLSKPGGQWLIDPILIDSAFQLAIIWERAHFDMTPLPSRIKSYRCFGSPPVLPVRCYYEARPLSGGHSLLNTYHFLDEKGKMVSLIEEMEASCSKSLNRRIKSVPQEKGNIL